MRDELNDLMDRYFSQSPNVHARCHGSLTIGFTNGVVTDLSLKESFKKKSTRELDTRRILEKSKFK